MLSRPKVMSRPKVGSPLPIPMGGLLETHTERLCLLRHDVMDHRPVHVGQPEISSCVSISQLLVIESQQVQQRGV